MREEGKYWRRREAGTTIIGISEKVTRNHIIKCLLLKALIHVNFVYKIYKYVVLMSFSHLG